MRPGRLPGKRESRSGPLVKVRARAEIIGPIYSALKRDRDNPYIPAFLTILKSFFNNKIGARIGL